MSYDKRNRDCDGTAQAGMTSSMSRLGRKFVPIVFLPEEPHATE